jgi:hypothetical protein
MGAGAKPYRAKLTGEECPASATPGRFLSALTFFMATFSHVVGIHLFHFETKWISVFPALRWLAASGETAPGGARQDEFPALATRANE